MRATVKCSNCGAEITNLNFTWGKQQLLWMLPALLICFVPLGFLFWPKGDFRLQLKITQVEKRIVDGQLEVIGTITNEGKSTWQFIHIDAEFFDAKGRFVDEITGNISSDMAPGEKEHFKLRTYSTTSAELLEADGVEMKVKVASASARRF